MNGPKIAPFVYSQSALDIRQKGNGRAVCQRPSGLFKNNPILRGQLYNSEESKLETYSTAERPRVPCNRSPTTTLSFAIQSVKAKLGFSLRRVFPGNGQVVDLALALYA